jgi:DNA processing protein
MMLLRDAPRTWVVKRFERGGPGYPAALSDLRDPPAALFLRGRAPDDGMRMVAIVGSRAATSYGRSVAQRLALDLASRGVAIVSGLAHGIDAAAHEGALEAGGVTLGVLASGVRQVTPAGHESLAAQLCERGALVSETEDGGPFGRGAFVKRNRIVAALAHATVVVEATDQSGALSTAEVARGLGRPLFAVPGDIDRASSRGTLGLLRRGARVCADAGDILSVLPAASDHGPDPEARLLAALAAAPRDLETVAAAAGLAAPDALARLLRLQWSGLAIPAPGGRWSARR